MDPYNPHPPIDNILFLLQAFVRVYQTTTQPFNFLFNVPEEQIVQVYIQHSLNARHVLLQLYGLFFPFVQHHPIHRQMLQEAFRYANCMIHTKFGTTPPQPDTIVIPQPASSFPDTPINRPPPARTTRQSAIVNPDLPPLTRPS